MSPSTIMPAAAALLRRSRVRASAHRDRPVTTGSVSGPGRTAPSAMASASIVAEAGIDHGVEHVDQNMEDRDQLRRPRAPPSLLAYHSPRGLDEGRPVKRRAGHEARKECHGATAEGRCGAKGAN